jgi:hypothetical protein
VLAYVPIQLSVNQLTFLNQRYSKEIKMAKSTKPVTRKTIISQIIASFANAKKAADDLERMNIQEQDKLIQQLVDSHLVACTTTKAEYMKGNSAKNPARLEVKELFEKLANDKYIAQGTVKTYQGCFWIAFEKGIPFSRNLANAQSEAKKKETAKAETAKAGKVEVTTIAEMHKTLSKALAQGRLLNQLVFVPALLDFIVEHYPDFKETVLAK